MSLLISTQLLSYYFMQHHFGKNHFCLSCGALDSKPTVNMDNTDKRHTK